MGNGNGIAVCACQGPTHQGEQPGRHERAIFRANIRGVQGSSYLLPITQTGSLRPTGRAAATRSPLDLAKLEISTTALDLVVLTDWVQNATSSRVFSRPVIKRSEEHTSEL